MLHPTKRRSTPSQLKTQLGGLARRKRFRQLVAESLERRMLLTTVTSVEPPAASHHAPVSTDVAANFDLDINPSTATDQTLATHTSQRGRLVGGAASVTTDGSTVTLDPSLDLFPGEVVGVTATSGIRSTSGDPVTPRVWNFRAGVPTGSSILSDSGQTTLGASYKNRVGDLDGDGDLDAYLLDSAGTNRILLNDGTGVFTPGQTLGTFSTYDVRLGDLDSDGDLDAFAVSELYFPNRVWINDGTGQFSLGQSLADHASLSVDLGDLDGDGDLDAYIGTRETNRVMINNGSGSFTDSGQSVGNSPTRKVKIGDVDLDGDLDLLSGNPDNPDRIWLNNGSANFTDSGQQIGGFNSRGIDFGDFDGDGDLDIFVGRLVSGNEVWINDGGIFTDSGQRLGDHDTWGVGLGDLDGDGDLDAMGGNAGQSDRIWLNDGTGVFEDAGQDIGTNSNTRTFALADLDSDGDLDAFIGALNGSRIWQNVNLTPSVTLAVDNTDVAEDGGSAVVTATLSAVSADPVTVELGLTGTATNDTDYTLSNTEIVIAADETTGTVTLTSVDDAVDEPDETAIIDILDVTNAQESGVQQVTVTILDDDEPAPIPDVTLSVDNAAIAEDGGVANFTATLSVVTTVPVTVELALSGTASAGDFTVSDTQIVVAAGATSGTISVTANQDLVDEPDETVIVEIANVVGGTEAGDQQQVTTITDDDETPMPDVALSVDATEIVENAGEATLTVTLSEVTTVPVTVDLGVTGTAAASDFAISATQVVVAPGSLEATVTVTAIQDEESEPDETIVVDVTAVTGGNEDGDQQQTITILDDDIPPSFSVTSLVSDASGFQIQLANELDVSQINLFDTQNAGMGPADVVVIGEASGPVSGSLVFGPPGGGTLSLEADSSVVNFVKTGGPLVPDTYTVTLRSAEDGFKDTAGALLDGDGDGTAGDDYVASFVVEAAPADARTIQIPDFVRGPGQDINLPADQTTGIPISISDGTNVRAVDLRLRYDPALLEITDATAPAGGTVVLNTTTPGLAILVYFNSSPLPAGESAFLELEATIPADNASENYGVSQLIDLHEVIVGDGNDNEFAVVVDDAVHLSSFFSDVSGNGRVNAGDAAQVARFAALIDSGFVGSLHTDPTIVGDISGNGRINAADASLVARFAALLPVDQIPPLPAGVVITAASPAKLEGTRAPIAVPPNLGVIAPVDPRSSAQSAERTAPTGAAVFSDAESFASDELESAMLDHLALAQLRPVDPDGGDDEAVLALLDALNELFSV